jgi:hypothetical protein
MAKRGRQVFHSATPHARAAVDNEFKWHCQVRAERVRPPDRDLADIYVGMMQFMVLQIIGLLLLLAFPQLALWLPAVLRDRATVPPGRGGENRRSIPAARTTS